MAPPIARMFSPCLLLLLSLGGSLSLNIPCYDATNEGNGNNAPCYFPYTYKNNVYEECITTNNGGVHWCSTTDNYPGDKKWGNCILDCTTQGCTTTTGGNSGGAACEFPFLYEEVFYFNCISGGMSSDLWCGTTSSFTDDGLWGLCSDECVTTQTPIGQASTENTVVPVSTENTALPSSSSSGSPTDSGTTPPTPDAEALQCPTSTFGGNSQGADCVFPFTYKSVVYNSCTTAEWTKPWCSTTDNYVADKKWGNCIINTLDGEQCSFPFEYDDVNYQECTDVAVGQPWCSTNNDVGSLSDDNWGVCDLRFEPNCQPTTGPSTPTPASVPTVVTTLPLSTDACIPSFEAVPGTLAYGGITQVGVNTVPDCIDVCLDTSGCVAFDFNTNTNICYIHFAGYEDKLKEDVTNVDQYRLLGCITSPATQPSTSVVGTTPVCVDTYEEVPLTLSYGGESESGANTVALCQLACSLDDECEAFDFNFNRNLCYLHDDGYLANVASNQNVNQYRRQRCEEGTTATAPSSPATTQIPTGTGSTVTMTTGSTASMASSPSAGSTPACEDSFESVPSTLSYGGDIQVFSDLDGCMEACLADTDCRAFDYDTIRDLCFFHDEDYLANVVTGVGYVDQYRRVDCTLSTEGFSVTTRETSLAGCVEYFEKTDRTLSFGGEEFVGANSVSECEEACLSLPSCVGFDYNRVTTKCYGHDEETILDTKDGEATNVDQYTLVECDTVSGSVSTEASTTMVTGFSPGCVDTFEVTENYLSYDGVNIGTYADPEDCMEICRADPDCAAFDYNVNSNVCYTHIEDDLADSKEGATCCDQYVRVPCVPATGSTASASSTEAGSTTLQTGITYAVTSSGTATATVTATATAAATSTAAASSTTATGTASTSASAATPACVSYLEFPQTLALNGIQQANSINTVEECKQVCTDNPDCLAVDFNSATNKCYMHVESSYLNRVYDETAGVQNINQYRKQDECATTPATTPTEPSLSTALPASTDGCVDAFVCYPNQWSPDGQQIASDVTSDECLDACRAYIDCDGVDYNKVTLVCFSHTDATLQNQQVSYNEATDQYIREFCD